MLELKNTIKLSFDDNHFTDITVENILSAKEILDKSPKKSKELLKTLVSLNLINAGLIRK